MTVPTTERRAAFDPDSACDYCGDRRASHDRLAREWESCATKAAYFATTNQT